MKHILSIDLGTSGMKAILFNEDGGIVCQAGSDYPTSYLAGNRAEQEADDWWQALIACLQTLRDTAPGLGAVAAVGLSGQMMAGFGIDSAGQAVGSALIHADTRAAAETEAVVTAMGAERIYALTGHRPSPAYSGPKLAWIRQHEPDRYRRIAYFLNPKDYLNFRLTGEIASDYSDASGTLLLNIKKHSWDEEMVEAFGLDMAKLPPVLPSSEPLGRVSPEAARLTGLPESALVVAGAGDGVCAGVGAGSVEPGVTYNYIGTTAWVATTSREAVVDPERRIVTFAHAVPGLYHPMGVMQSAGATIEWFRRRYLAHIVDDGAAYAELDRLIQNSPPASKDIIFLPYLLGERSPWWNTECRAGWYGLRQDHTLADITRAVFEGISHNLGLIAAILDRHAPFAELSLLGGGGLSASWPQILCNSYGKPLSIHKEAVSITARGAAVIAAVGATIYKDFSTAKTFISLERRLLPDPALHKVMQRGRESLVRIYQSLYS